MHRIDADGHDSNLFTEGDPSLGDPATKVDDDWLNAVQEELCNAIEMDGTTLVKGTNTQLRSLLALLLGSITPGGRLTIQSGIPVADGNDAGTIYYTPYKSNKIALYNGTRWVLHTFAELSQALTDATKSPAAAASNSNYDLFVWNDAGTLRCTRGPAWTSLTNPGSGAGTSERELFEGRYVNKVAITNGPAARRGLYVGTIYVFTDSLVDDAPERRGLWNTYNRVERAMRVAEATNSWAYTTATFRQANNSAANQLDFVRGLAEDMVQAEVLASALNDTGAYIRVGIGLDSSAANDSATLYGESFSDGFGVTLRAKYAALPGLGRHTLHWLEWAEAVGTTTWQGDAAGTLQTGIVGSLPA